ncbi:MAG: SIS domain-containing protein [Candidatus Caldarchaeum sp.]
MAVDENFLHAWRLILKSPEMYRRGFESGTSLPPLPQLSIFSRVYVLGMGGSGIVGDIVSGLKQRDSKVVVEPVKSMSVPPNVGPNSFVVVVSYSGNTTETNWAYIDAFSRNAFVVGVSSGGRLTESMKMKGLEVVEVSKGLQPRYAVPEMVGVVYGILTPFDGFNPREFLKTIDELEAYAKDFEDMTRNAAVELAEKLVDKPVIIIGPEHLSSVLHRFKCQLNENSKHPAYYAVVPEAFHNELEGWTMIEKFSYVFLRSGYEHPMISEALDWAEEHLRKSHADVFRVFVKSSSRQAELVKLIFFTDVVTVALARAKHVDPFALKTIPQLRPLLRKYLP